MHTVFMREHNRLCDEMNAREDFDDLSFNAKFDRARKVRHLLLNVHANIVAWHLMLVP